MNFYWGFNSNMSYLNYLTIYSFRKLNPDWEIVLYRPIKSSKYVLSEQINDFHLEYSGKDYSKQLENIEKLSIIDFDFSKISIDNNLAEVYKSDFLRWFLLSTKGGAWADLDILFIRSMTSIDINNRMIIGESSKLDTAIIFKDLGYHPIGFYLSKKNNPFFAKIFKMSKENFSNTDYQSIGEHLLSKLFPGWGSIKNQFPDLNIADMHANTVYPFLSHEVNKIFKGNFIFSLISKTKIRKNTIGIHWYNGSNKTKEYINEFERRKKIKGIISKYIKIIEQR
jgi:hypothetical protein